MSVDDHETRLMAASDARFAAYQRVGFADSNVLAPVVNPALMGGPVWPGRPAWRVVRRPTGILVFSDGLSDPWEDQTGPGLGLASVTLPEGVARLVALIALFPSELAFVMQNGDRSRPELARRLAASPTGHVSSFTRSPAA